MSDIVELADNLLEHGWSEDDYAKICAAVRYLRSQADEIERMQPVIDAARDALQCLADHDFEPGEDPRISDLATALDAYDREDKPWL